MFVRSLQGEVIPLTRTRRGGFGNSKILAPEFRDPRGRTAASFAIHISCENAPGLARTVSCAASQDTAIFLRINRTLWRRAWPYIRGHRIVAVGVQLGHVEYLTNRNGDMLRHLPAAAMARGERAAADFINGCFGSGAITYGVNKPHPGFFERG